MPQKKTIWCMMPACLESAETYFANSKALAAHMSAIHPEVLEAKKAAKKAAAAKRKLKESMLANEKAANEVKWTATATGHKFIDIGVNLTDPMFRGEYRGKEKHPSDYEAVLARGRVAGMDRIIITAGSLQDVTNSTEQTIG